uniref:Uncharacterized protein n=1 Tax=Rhizophagus irregularis (strain DAOM 181602 / DAOM 197198 / MUCL 43194) TaxID=747089 RepID=U9TKM7_RHIID
MDLDKSEYNQSINDNSQENDSEITRLQARLKVFADDKAQQLKELRKILSTLRSDKEKLTNKFTESEKNLEKTLDENKKLKDKISATSKNLDNYSAIQNENKVQLKQFEDKLKEKSYNQLVTDIKVKNGEISEFQNKSNELEEIIQLQKKMMNILRR